MKNVCKNCGKEYEFEPRRGTYKFTYCSDTCKKEYNAKDKLIQDAFGVKNKEIVTTAIKYIEAGDNEKLGLLMNKAQSIFDNEVFHNTDFLEVKLHEIVTNGDISKLILGAKGVGSHGDGAVQFLVDTIERQEKLVKTLHNLGYKAYKLDI